MPMSFLEGFTEHLAALERSAGEGYAHEVIQHEHRVEALIRDFSAAIGIPTAERRDACLASRFHDIGKLRIPQEVLLKPSALDPEERLLIEAHGALGADILSETRLELPDGFQEAVRYHHERWDGHGYEGLKGLDIPHVSRMLSIVDVYDALTADRVYRAAMSEAEALLQMVSQSSGDGDWFDPVLFRQFIDWRCGVSTEMGQKEIRALRTYLANGQPPPLA